MNNKIIDVRDAFFDSVYEIAKNDKEVIFLASDHTAFSLGKFQKDLPNQFINVGISEQNMVSVAAGLAMNNKFVFIYGITPFVTMRCLEQININLCAMKSNVSIISIGSGLIYSSDGPTHHGTQELAIMSSLPNLSIYTASDAFSSDQLPKIAYKNKGPSLLRIEKGSLENLYLVKKEFSEDINLIIENEEILILSTGITTQKAFEISNELKKQNIKVGVVDILRFKPLNEEKIVKLIKNCKKIITIEENIPKGGIASAISEIIVSYNLNCKLSKYSLKNEYLFESGPREWMHEKHGLSRDDIIKDICEI